MGKTHNINTYSDEYAENIVSHDYKIKGVKKGKKKSVGKFKKDYKWEEDSLITVTLPLVVLLEFAYTFLLTFLYSLYLIVLRYNILSIFI